MGLFVAVAAQRKHRVVASVDNGTLAKIDDRFGDIVDVFGTATIHLSHLE